MMKTSSKGLSVMSLKKERLSVFLCWIMSFSPIGTSIFFLQSHLQTTKFAFGLIFVVLLLDVADGRQCLAE